MLEHVFAYLGKNSLFLHKTAVLQYIWEHYCYFPQFLPLVRNIGTYCNYHSNFPIEFESGKQSIFHFSSQNIIFTGKTYPSGYTQVTSTRITAVQDG